MSGIEWDFPDREALGRLRARFLAGEPVRGSYWESESQLAAYDATFGERIGWKWDAVLAELSARGYSPPPGPLLDFGCGSGVAGRRVLRAFGAAAFTALLLADRSPLALDHARRRAVEEHPGLAVEKHRDEAPGTLVVSHVLSELDERGAAALTSLARRAMAVLWVEPGARDVSRRLSAIRDSLAPDYAVVAPCPHDAPCGVLAPGNERHWCHFLAAPPPGVLHDSNWVRFAKSAGFDLRRLPYSFLVLDRRPPPPRAPEALRRIGEPRVEKGRLHLYVCDRTGLARRTIQKRDDPSLFKAIAKGRDREA